MSDAVQLCRWHAVADTLALQQRACGFILDCARQALRDRGQFHIVLSGGDTPREIYRRLGMAEETWLSWHDWHVYFGDERCLPADHAERNSRMALQAWLGGVPIPAAQIHVMPAELGPLEAARRYAETLKGLADFDLVLLGLGEDGHTASLFPAHDLGVQTGSPDTVAVFDAPKPPLQRVSLSAARLSRARKVLFIVSGPAKQDAVAAWRQDRDIPARAIRPEAGVDIVVESGLLAGWR